MQSHHCYLRSPTVQELFAEAALFFDLVHSLEVFVMSPLALLAATWAVVAVQESPAAGGSYFQTLAVLRCYSQAVGWETLVWPDLSVALCSPTAGGLGLESAAVIKALVRPCLIGRSGRVRGVGRPRWAECDGGCRRGARSPLDSSLRRRFSWAGGVSEGGTTAIHERELFWATVGSWKYGAETLTWVERWNEREVARAARR